MSIFVIYFTTKLQLMVNIFFVNLINFSFENKACLNKNLTLRFDFHFRCPTRHPRELCMPFHLYRAPCT